MTKIIGLLNLYRGIRGDKMKNLSIAPERLHRYFTLPGTATYSINGLNYYRIVIHSEIEISSEDLQHIMSCYEVYYNVLEVLLYNESVYWLIPKDKSTVIYVSDKETLDN